MHIRHIIRHIRHFCGKILQWATYDLSLNAPGELIFVFWVKIRVSICGEGFLGIWKWKKVESAKNSTYNLFLWQRRFIKCWIYYVPSKFQINTSTWTWEMIFFVFYSIFNLNCLYWKIWNWRFSTLKCHISTKNIDRDFVLVSKNSENYTLLP